MWEDVLNLAISNGLFAVLFLGLFIYFLKDSKTREIKYQETIDKLGDALKIVESVKNDVEEIKLRIEDKTIRLSKKKEEKNEKQD